MKKYKKFNLGDEKKINEFFAENAENLLGAVITQQDGLLTIIYETEREKYNKLDQLEKTKWDLWGNRYKTNLTLRWWESKIPEAKKQLMEIEEQLQKVSSAKEASKLSLEKQKAEQQVNGVESQAQAARIQLEMLDFQLREVEKAISYILRNKK